MKILVRFKDLLVESLKDNKKLIIGLYILFIVTFVLAWILSGDMVQNSLTSAPDTNVTDITPVSASMLFVNNETGGILTYIGSIFFGIFAVASLVYNAINFGMVGQLFSIILPNGGLKYIVYLIPHGIFEFTATVIESAAGILLFLFIWRLVRAWMSSETQGFSEAFAKTKKILIQSLILMIFSTILLLIAAPIEAYFSVPFSEFIVGV